MSVCPNCGGSVEPGDVRCRYCGFELAGPDVAPPAIPDGASLEDSQRAWEAWAQEQATEPRAEPAPSDEATRVLGDPERDKETRIVQPPPPPPAVLRGGRAAAGGARGDDILSEDFDRALAVLRSIYKRLHPFERISLWTTIVAFVGAFSPWYYESGYGYLSGVQTLLGGVTALALGATLLVLYLRFTRRWSLWAALLQFLLVAGAAVLSIYLAIVPPDGLKLAPGLPLTAISSGVGAATEFVGMLARA